MKKIVVILFALIPFFAFPQGAQKTSIDWITLEKAEKFAEKYNKNILIYFYKKDCPYCEEMQRETFSDPTIINLINHNFLPVKIDSRTKDIITYNGIDYSNQQPESHGATWRHDFYHEVAQFTQKGKSLTTTPTIVLFNDKFEKLTVFPGKQPKPLLLRRINSYIK